jgi:hypothetical protein
MDQLEFLKIVADKLERAGLRFMVVGSYASGYWGEPRSTYDLDVVVALAAEDIGIVQRAFPESDYYLSSRAALDAVIARSQFNIIHPDSGNKIDVMIEQQSGWAKQQLARRRQVEFAKGFHTWVGAPEDIIISKMLYYREGQSDKHLRDIAGMLKVSRDIIDRDYVTKWAKELDVLDIWQAILQRVGMA